MTSFYDATKITGIIPIPRFFNSGSYRFSDWKAKSLNPHFVVAYISRRFPHAAVTVDTDGEWPRVNLGATTLEIRGDITDLGGGDYRAWETPRDAGERLLAAHGWDQSLSVKERIAALVRPDVRMKGVRNGCVIPIKHGEKIEVTVADGECTITVGDTCYHRSECGGIWDAAYLADTLAPR